MLFEAGDADAASSVILELPIEKVGIVQEVRVDLPGADRLLVGHDFDLGLLNLLVGLHSLHFHFQLYILLFFLLLERAARPVRLLRLLEPVARLLFLVAERADARIAVHVLPYLPLDLVARIQIGFVKQLSRWLVGVEVEVDLDLAGQVGLALLAERHVLHFLERELLRRDVAGATVVVCERGTCCLLALSLRTPFE